MLYDPGRIRFVERMSINDSAMVNRPPSTSWNNTSNPFPVVIVQADPHGPERLAEVVFHQPVPVLLALGSLPSSLAGVLGVGHNGLRLQKVWGPAFQAEGVVVHPQNHVGVVRQQGAEVVAVLTWVEEDRAVVQPLELNVAVVHEQHRRVVVRVEDRAAALDLHASLEDS